MFDSTIYPWQQHQHLTTSSTFKLQLEKCLGNMFRSLTVQDDLSARAVTSAPRPVNRGSGAASTFGCEVWRMRTDQRFGEVIPSLFHFKVISRRGSITATCSGKRKGLHNNSYYFISITQSEWMFGCPIYASVLRRLFRERCFINDKKVISSKSYTVNGKSVILPQVPQI